MSSIARFRNYALAVGLFSSFLLGDDGVLRDPSAGLMSSAEARVGRPLTAGSVAGVARRTTRRVVRRSTTYIAALPAGCARVVVNGVALSLCGGVYYQPYSGRYVVVYVD
ncbi:hypothetical protein EOA13_15740 [Mesorhizobium sp. M7A.F.Ca.US.011.01.1.1]|uniref:hypothetical protein n=1 Tax=Mesorhizobium sp. M7A.F.Ca.US.011.01.1.1 TaxID=2496741 RepID=UPI000FCA7537|nr:hypothetical protein [Mesorhizobium sp. M7A.F.Ca.US.011.01.1.1]RUX28846.1 hypothetical protein EOA13_15740 [Mesorhizobium sp. M7A.F.Ca.US.011.01.1.1]